jgi:hypothetical protein
MASSDCARFSYCSGGKFAGTVSTGHFELLDGSQHGFLTKFNMIEHNFVSSGVVEGWGYTVVTVQTEPKNHVTDLPDRHHQWHILSPFICSDLKNMLIQLRFFDRQQYGEHFLRLTWCKTLTLTGENFKPPESVVDQLIASLYRNPPNAVFTLNFEWLTPTPEKRLGYVFNRRASTFRACDKISFRPYQSWLQTFREG